MFEELGLDIDFSNIRPSFTINFDEGFDDYFFVKKDINVDNLSLQYEEVQKARWADLQEILEMKKSGQFIPYWFLENILAASNKNGAF